MASSARPYRMLSCIKVLLIIFTMFLLFTGIVFLATGIYSLMALNHYVELSTELNISMVPVVLCGIGGFIVISGLFGFLTTIKNNKCMINCYCLLIGVVFLTEIAGAIAAAIFMNHIEDSFKIGINKAMQDYNPSIENPIDKAQSELHCCGGESFEEWFSTTWAKETRQCQLQSMNKTTVPVTCCKSLTDVESVGTTASTTSESWPYNGICYCGDDANAKYIYQKGCFYELFGDSGQTLHYLLILLFSMAAMQLLGIVLSICMYRKLREITASRRHY